MILAPAREALLKKETATLKTPLLVMAFISGISHASFQVDKTRPHLDSLESRGRLDWADYQGDFLISQSAEITENPATEVIKRLKAQHNRTKIPSTQAGPQLSLPPSLVEGDQLRALTECSLEKCNVKLHSESEVKSLLKAKEKAPAFRDILESRIDSYSQGRKLKGYEAREDNIPFFRKALESVRFFKVKYPKTYKHLLGGFWNGPAPYAQAKQNYLRTELIRLTGEKAQPVFRISDNVEFQENGFVMVEVHIYTNHFFDSSLRLFEVFPWGPDPKKAVFIVTDIMEVDELKKSALIRNLLKSPMEEAICEYRKSEMKELR